jgi:hypothetical protein
MVWTRYNQPGKYKERAPGPTSLSLHSVILCTGHILFITLFYDVIFAALAQQLQQIFREALEMSILIF